MINTLIIFGAKYLFLAIIIIALGFIIFSKRERQKDLIVFFLMALPLIYVFAKIISLFYFNERPFVVGNFAPLIPHAPDNGFPSDHTLISAAIASVIIFYDKKVGIVLWILTVLVGISRVLSGVHHTIDIIASMIISLLVAWLLYTYIMPIIKKQKSYINFWK
ncbi:MAG: phosphatase PAP2 family protein [Patescibacteria group bacterium]|jgi:undecaprenyl-diphosphatase